MIEPPNTKHNNIFQYLLTIFMSLEAQIEGLQMFIKDQKQRCKEENAKIEGKWLWYFVSKRLKKNYRPFIVSNSIASSNFNQIEQFLCHWK